jgi:hypothetical protein
MIKPMTAESATILVEILQKKFEYKMERGLKVQAILCHHSLVMPGWVFMIEKWGEIFITISTGDLVKLLNSTPFEEAVEYYPAIFDAPILNDEKLLNKVKSGVYLWAGQTFPIDRVDKPLPSPATMPESDIFVE